MFVLLCIFAHLFLLEDPFTGPESVHVFTFCLPMKRWIACLPRLVTRQPASSFTLVDLIFCPVQYFVVFDSVSEDGTLTAFPGSPSRLLFSPIPPRRYRSISLTAPLFFRARLYPRTLRPISLSLMNSDFLSFFIFVSLPYLCLNCAFLLIICPLAEISSSS